MQHFGLTLLDKGAASIAEERETLERVAAAAEVVGGGEVHSLRDRRIGIALGDFDQAAGIAVGQLVEEHGLYGAEDGRVRPDAEREGSDGDQGKQRGLPKLAECVSNVCKHG